MEKAGLSLKDLLEDLEKQRERYNRERYGGQYSVSVKLMNRQWLRHSRESGNPGQRGGVSGCPPARA